MSASDNYQLHEIDHERASRAVLERLRSRTSKAFDDERELRLRPEEVMIIVELGILGRLEEEIAAGREKECQKRRYTREATITSHSTQAPMERPARKISTSSTTIAKQEGVAAIQRARRISNSRRKN